MVYIRGTPAKKGWAGIEGWGVNSHIEGTETV